MSDQSKERKRLLALEHCDVESIGRSGMFDALLRLATDLSGAVGAAVNLIDATRQVSLAAHHYDLPLTIARKDTFCTTVIEEDCVLEVPDAKCDPRFANNPFVSTTGGIRFYAGFPIRSADGFVLGALCLTDIKPHNLNAQQKDRLLALAEVASQLLDVHRADYGRRRRAALFQVQSEIFHQVAVGTPLNNLADKLIVALEAHLPGAHGALMKADTDGALHWVAGPSLPYEIATQCTCHESKTACLPCSVAAHGRVPIECADILADPRWRNSAACLIKANIAAFWSIPLFATGGALVGTFAIYFNAVHETNADERELVNVAASAAAILIEREAAHSSLVESERRLHEAQEIARLGAYSVYANGKVRTSSVITNEILGLPRDLLTVSTEVYNRMILPEDLPAVLAYRLQAEQSEVPIKITYRIRRQSDDAIRWIEGYGRHVRDPDGKVLRFTGVIQDITERRLAEQSLRLNQRAVDSSSTGIVIIDALQHDMPIIHVNPAFERMTGYSSDEIVGKNSCLFQNDEGNKPVLTQLKHAFKNHQEGHVLLRNFRRNGEEYWVDLNTAPVRDEHGIITHYVGFQNDCTDRIRYEKELAHQAGHDMLTGLANRSLLVDRLDQALLRGCIDPKVACHAVTFIDLDHFKLINDSLGHSAGDQLLKECACRIASQVDPRDTVARMGGDEFVILLHDVADEVTAVRQIDAILATLNAPFLIDGQKMSVTASAGIALYPAHGDTASALLRHADVAMYDAKSRGRAGSRVFSEALRLHAVDRLQIKEELIAALALQQFCLHYQPKIHAQSGELVGFEALVRWNHPSRGLLYPGSFIDAAEAFGMISDLGDWVMLEACRQAATWHMTRRFPVPVAVNVSAAQFRKSDFFDGVQRTLAETGLAPKHLELEITESLVMESPEQFIHILAQLHELGVAISVDDFGTGYSSLSFIKQFPIDNLKIDRSFVNDISTDPSDAAICNTIITMAHNLGLQVIAEGVETIEQAAFLRDHGCDILQGFLIAKPLSADADFGIFPRIFGISQNLQTVGPS